MTPMAEHWASFEQDVCAKNGLSRHETIQMQAGFYAGAFAMFKIMAEGDPHSTVLLEAAIVEIQR